MSRAHTDPLIPVAGADGIVAAGIGAPPPSPDAAGNAFKIVHRLLRGRFMLTMGLAACGAAVGAIAGYSSIRPKFETRGMISIQPTLSRRIYESENNQPMQSFTSFVNKQVALIKTARVMSLAMESPAWRELGQGTGPAAEKRLKRALKIEAPPQAQEIIFVSCIHEDARYTATAVAEIIKAYMSLYGAEGSIDAETIKVVERELADCIRNIESVTQEIRSAAAAAGYGTEDLAKVHAARYARLLDLEARVDELSLRLTEAGVQPEDLPDIAGPVPAAPRPTTVAEIATVDPEMRGLLARRTDLAGKIEYYKALGYGEQHPEMKVARAALTGVEASIAILLKNWEDAGGAAPAITPGVRIGETVEESKARYALLRQELLDRRKELQELDVKRSDMDKLLARREASREEQKTITQRLRALQVEASGPEKTRGRISVASTGETPPFPSVDKRKQLAALGFVAGGGLPVGVMLLLGFLDRRFRYSDQAGELPAAPALLGILPVLPKELDNAEQRAVAAHCVHQVRLLLQIGAASTGRKVYAITSPTAGDGKTSLALSLGLSFSAAGSRTLLIDFDMIGTGLTSNLRVDNGHGLADALREGQLNGTLTSVASDRLWVIPSRAQDDHYVSRVSAESVKRLIDQVRGDYDVILIDTGPMLGSLEAPLVCAEADGVVMVVGRGQSRGYVDQAFARVASVGGRLVGMVFNRATPGDFRRSVSSTSMRSVPRALPAPEPGHRPGADRLGDAGPVVRTIALELDAEADAGGLPGHDARP